MPEHGRHYPDRAYDPARLPPRPRFGDGAQLSFKADDEIDTATGTHTEFMSNLSGYDVMRHSPADMYTVGASHTYSARTPEGMTSGFDSFGAAAAHVADHAGYVRDPRSGAYHRQDLN